MQRREVWKVIVFGLITLGIYDLFWLYKTRKELVANGAQIPPIKILFAPLFGLLLVTILQFSLRFLVMAGGGGDSPEDDTLKSIMNILSLLVGMLALLAFIPINIYWWYKYSKGAALVTQDKASFDMVFWVGLLLSFFSVGFIMPGIIQDAFNKVAGGDATKPPYAEPPYPKLPSQQ